MSGADRAWVGYWGCMAIGASLDGIGCLFFGVLAVIFSLYFLIADYVEKKGTP